MAIIPPGVLMRKAKGGAWESRATSNANSPPMTSSEYQVSSAELLGQDP